jgi:hypothetical protein
VFRRDPVQLRDSKNTTSTQKNISNINSNINNNNSTILSQPASTVVSKTQANNETGTPSYIVIKPSVDSNANSGNFI